MSSWAALHVREHRRGSNRNPLPTSALHRICCHSTEYRGCQAKCRTVFLYCRSRYREEFHIAVKKRRFPLVFRVAMDTGVLCPTGRYTAWFCPLIEISDCTGIQDARRDSVFRFLQLGAKICPLSVTDSMCCNSLCPESSSGF